MSDHRKRVAGRGLYDEKFYDSLREVKRLLDRHESEASKSSSSTSQSSSSMNNGSGSQPNENAPGQPARPQPEQPIWPPPRPLRGGNAPRGVASDAAVDRRPPLELFIDPSWQFEWDGTYYYCNWPGCHRVFEATEITSRHRATHDRYRYIAGEIPLPSYPQPDQDHAASTTAGQQISLPLR